MRKPFRFFALLLALMLLLSGCGSKGQRQLKENELLAVGSNICTRPEAMIFLLSQRSIYARSYGDDIWSVKLEEGSFEEYIKEALLNYLELLYLTDAAAVASGVTLSEAEKSSVNAAAGSFLEALGEEGQKMTGITLTMARTAFTRYARAQIFYRMALNKTIKEISDEEARAISLEILTFPMTTELPVVQNALEELQKGTTVSTVLKSIEGSSLRTETVVRGTYGGTFDLIAFALKKNQWSTVIPTIDGYCILKCLSPYEAQETAHNKALLENQSREGILEEALNAYGEKTSLVINPVLWEKVKLSDLAGMPYANFYDYTAAFTAG